MSAARVDGDRAALRRTLRNLTDNAVRHARQRIGLVLREEDGWALLHVDDDGPGVPVADRSRVFQRFVLERKYYARGIGTVLTVDVSAGGVRDELIRFTP